MFVSRLLSPCTERNDGYPSLFGISLPFLMPEALRDTTYPSRAPLVRETPGFLSTCSDEPKVITRLGGRRVSYG